MPEVSNTEVLPMPVKFPIEAECTLPPPATTDELVVYLLWLADAAEALGLPQAAEALGTLGYSID